MRHAAAPPELPRHFVVHNRHELIQAAAMRVVAAKGYHGASVRDICAEAHISAKCFHEHFSGKEEAVLSGVEAGVDQAMGDCRAVFLAAETWADGIWDCLDAYTDWFRCEPAFGRTTVVELLTVGPPGLELLRSLLDAFALFLEPGYRLLNGATPGMLDEVVTGKIFELMHTHVVHHSWETILTILPDLARASLTPFLGPRATEELIARRQAARRQAARQKGRLTRRGSA
jgi:AcrR family transcriptional regulator